jgi:SAM-dependent methyltransferase
VNESPDRHFGGENLEVMQEAEKYNRFLRNLIRRYAGDASMALDFGAGIGTFSNSLDIPPGRVHCVEPDPAARELLASKGFLPHADLSELDDACIDYLFSLNVLEHIEDDRGTLADLYRVLEPGGRLFIYVPAFNALYTSMDSHVGHHRRYRLSEMAKLLKQAGFSVEKIAYTDALGFFATLAFKLFDTPEPAPLNRKVVRMYDRYLFPLSRVLSLPFARILGKNLFVVATRPIDSVEEQSVN